MSPRRPGRILVVTGTGTGVGKTVVTAAVAALARARGEHVAAVKPAQTGVAPGEPGDLAVVARLAGLPADSLVEPYRFPLPLSPEAAARAEGRSAPQLEGVATMVQRLAEQHDLVLVEGAGGLLVRYDGAGSTVADLAVRVGAPLLVVVEPGLGTLNLTALTLEAAAARAVPVAAVVVGRWPRRPEVADRSNLRDLEELAAAPLGGALADGAAGLAAEAFAAAAAEGLGPGLGGRFDAADFRRTHDLPEV